MVRDRNNLPLALAACVLAASLLAQALAEFYIQFKVDRPKTLPRKILGDDYYDQPEIRVYRCQYYKNPLNKSEEFRCARHVFGWKWRRSGRGSIFFNETNFYLTYLPLANHTGVPFKFSDIKSHQLPAEVHIGAPQLAKFPEFNQTQEMVEKSKDHYRKKTKEWINIVQDETARTNLITFLATPDVRWTNDTNLTDVYLKAYVPYIVQVIVDYDAYIFEKSLPLNNSDAKVGWRGPTWLDWKPLTPLRKFYNMYWKNMHKMHGVWLWNAEVELRLRKMIPLLIGKMLDPCMLPALPQDFHLGDGTIIPNERFLGNSTREMLCSVYCRFFMAVDDLISSSLARYLLIDRLFQPRREWAQPECRHDCCTCVETSSRSWRVTVSFILRAIINRHQVQYYNETHEVNPDL